MPLPTVQSSGDPLKARFDKVIGAMERARLISVTEKAVLAAGDTPIQTIIDGIYKPFARSAAEGGLWHLISDLSAGKHFRNYYRAQLSKRISFVAGDENLTTDRITLDGNDLAVSDPVRIVGPGTPPTGLLVDTNYWIFDKQGQGCSFKPTLGGAKIDLTAAGSGTNFVELRVGTDFTTLINALEAVVDEIIVEVPVTTTTLELRAVKFDKALASSTSGLSDAVLTSTQTATLQTKLQDVVDAIEAPV